MSAFRPRGARRRPLAVPRPVTIDMARISSAIRGCRCEPDYELHHDEFGTLCRILHDRSCPAHPDHEETPRDDR